MADGLGRLGSEGGASGLTVAPLSAAAVKEAIKLEAGARGTESGRAQDWDTQSTARDSVWCSGCEVCVYALGVRRSVHRLLVRAMGGVGMIGLRSNLSGSSELSRVGFLHVLRIFHDNYRIDSGHGTSLGLCKPWSARNTGITLHYLSTCLLCDLRYFHRIRRYSPPRMSGADNMHYATQRLKERGFNKMEIQVRLHCRPTRTVQRPRTSLHTRDATFQNRPILTTQPSSELATQNLQNWRV
eukprot:816648-Rhodomonas_salina.1